MKKIVFNCILTMIIPLFAIGQGSQNFNYQGIIRNSSGELVKNTSITVNVSLLQGSSTGTLEYSESHTATTNNYGQFSIKVGAGSMLSGSFSGIDWSTEMYMKTEVANPAGGTLMDMGTVQLISVPYALYAKNVENNDDADANPINEIQALTISNDTIYLSNGGFVKLPFDQVNDADFNPSNELQNLTLTGDTLRISNGNHVVFPYDSSRWVINGNKLYYNTGNVGIGSTNPMSKLEVKSSSTGALFQVINANNDTVFAVYPDGVRVFVDPSAKGGVGGFAVSGRTPTKAGTKVEYFRVTPDSTRIYVNDSISLKGGIGGFAVSGRTPTKGIANDYLFVTSDSTRITFNTNSKGNVGGFAVSGRTPTKESVNSLLNLFKDNYFIGHASGINTTGTNNLFLGYESGMLSQKGNENVMIGSWAGYENNGNYNVFLGFESGYSNIGGLDSRFAHYNTFLGYQSGKGNTTGWNNVYIGYRSGASSASSTNNVFIGVESGRLLTDGSNNVFIGPLAGWKSTICNNNVFVGNAAGMSNTKGYNNIYIGEGSGAINDTTIGNVLIGNKAGGYQKNGPNNTMIGNGAGYSATGSANVFIGNNAGGTSTGSNLLIIDNSNTATPLIYGDFSKDQLTINKILNLGSMSTYPVAPSEGDIIRLKGHSTNPDGLYIYTGSIWKPFVTW